MHLCCNPWKHPFGGCQTATDSKDIQAKASTRQIHHLRRWDDIHIASYLLATHKHIIPCSDLFIQLCMYLLIVDIHVHMYQYHLTLSAVQHCQVMSP